MASGTGYLSGYMTRVFKDLIRVDKSEEMLQQTDFGERRMVIDLVNTSELRSLGKADVVTCLAAFHHVKVPDDSVEWVFGDQRARPDSSEVHVAITPTMRLQEQVVNTFIDLLDDKGMMLIIDVPGYPDESWNEDQTGNDYHDESAEICDSIGKFNRELMLKMLGEDCHTDLSERMAKCSTVGDVIRTMPMPGAGDSHARLAPTDFFDKIVDAFGRERHYAYFLRPGFCEYLVQKRTGAEIVLCRVCPTPWLFGSEREAIWYIHELFGIGECWDYENIPHDEYTVLKNIVREYLGIFTHEQYTCVYWQLLYFVVRRGER